MLIAQENKALLETWFRLAMFHKQYVVLIYPDYEQKIVIGEL